jgi:hypothetical protein
MCPSARVTLPPRVHQATVPPPQHGLVIVVGLVEVQLVEVLCQVDAQVEERPGHLQVQIAFRHGASRALGGRPSLRRRLVGSRP